MSLIETTIAQCPHCSAPQSLKIYTSVNITLDPALKEKVLKGTINDNVCTACHKTIQIASALLYHDMVNKFIISLDMPEDGKGVFDADNNPFREQKGYIIRKVKSYPELYEKIMIFDNNLNDVAIKNIADGFKDMFKQVVEDVEMHVFFGKIEKKLFSKKLVFNCFSHPEQMMQLKQPIKKLDKTIQDVLFDIDSLRN